MGQRSIQVDDRLHIVQLVVGSVSFYTKNGEKRCVMVKMSSTVRENTTINNNNSNNKYKKKSQSPPVKLFSSSNTGRSDDAKSR